MKDFELESNSDKKGRNLFPLFSIYKQKVEVRLETAENDMSTRTAGIFTAGDCRVKAVRQVATAVSDGAVAALSACEYLDRK